MIFCHLHKISDRLSIEDDELIFAYEILTASYFDTVKQTLINYNTNHVYTTYIHYLTEYQEDADNNKMALITMPDNTEHLYRKVETLSLIQ